MFGLFGSKKGNDKSSKRSSKSEDRYIDRKADEASWGYLGSAKSQSDRDASR